MGDMDHGPQARPTQKDRFPSPTPTKVLRLSRPFTAGRAKPTPILPILQHATTICLQSDTDLNTTMADMIVISFFYLLRPRANMPSHVMKSPPISASNMSTHLAIAPPETQLRQMLHSRTKYRRLHTFAGLEFDSQKNSVRGELIGPARSGYAYWCPVAYLVRRIMYVAP
jgi:hypothetical protein